jgi:terminase small subunit-like protein
MPRRSAASLDVAAPSFGEKRIAPRRGAPAEVAAVFKELVTSVPANHFRPADRDLLEQFAQAVVLARQAYVELEEAGPVINGRASPWLTALEKAHRSTAALSVRLRLGPQTRLDPKTVARARVPATDRPNYIDLHGEDE